MKGTKFRVYGMKYNTTYKKTPTLLKTDAKGNIQWSTNYSSIPDLGIDSSIQRDIVGYKKDGNITTSDGGFVYWKKGIIIKTDSKNNTQWIKNVTYPTVDAYPTYEYPLHLFSIIETSNGALAIIGVGYDAIDNPSSGKIYLHKTEAFLPLPSPAQLPTPITTPITNMNPALSIPDTVIIIIIIGLLITTSLILYRRHRRHG